MGPPWTSQAGLPDDALRAAGGDEFGPGLDRAEVAFLVREEWARTADDILWRRTKAGLAASPEQRAALARFLTGASIECVGAPAP
jgi:glycerol-3-phosphate dehydrogenase